MSSQRKESTRDDSAEPATPVGDGPPEAVDAAEQEIEYPSDETDEG